MGGFLILLSMVIGFVSFIGIIRPMRRLWLPTRKRAAVVFLSSFPLFILGGALLPDRTPEEPAVREVGEQEQQVAQGETVQEVREREREDQAERAVVSRDSVSLASIADTATVPKAAARSELQIRGIEFTEDAFCLSAESGDLEVVKLFVSAGMDINFPHCGWRDGTALHEATGEGHIEVVRLLVENGIDINARSVDNTALDEAAGEGHVEVMRFLAENGADVTGALHWAARKGQIEAMRFLLRTA